jgi:hypothetical protein
MNDETHDDPALAAQPRPAPHAATDPGPAAPESDAYDFGGACFDLDSPTDREILRFILSQALYGESTGVYCGRSLYSARSLEAARFYVRQARQELAHLELFADILRALELTPLPPHPVLRMLSAHNNYYPLKVLMEHAVGEGMVLDVFKDLLLQTLPDSDPRVASIKKKLRVVVREEAEHVAWGEKETRYVLDDKPWLREPFMGLVELQLAALPWLVARLGRGNADHPVLKQLMPFVKHVQARVRAQGKRLGFYPEHEPRTWQKGRAIGLGLGVYAMSQFWPSRSTLDKSYLRELGFEPEPETSARARRS